MLNIYNILVNLAKLIGKHPHIITNIASISFHNTKLTKIGLSIRLGCNNLRSLVFNFCFHLNSREWIGDNKLLISNLGRLLLIRITMEKTLLHKVVAPIPFKDFIIRMTVENSRLHTIVLNTIMSFKKSAIIKRKTAVSNPISIRKKHLRRRTVDNVTHSKYLSLIFFLK